MKRKAQAHTHAPQRAYIVLYMAWFFSELTKKKKMEWKKKRERNRKRKAKWQQAKTKQRHVARLKSTKQNPPLPPFQETKKKKKSEIKWVKVSRALTRTGNRFPNLNPPLPNKGDKVTSFFSPLFFDGYWVLFKKNFFFFRHLWWLLCARKWACWHLHRDFPFCTVDKRKIGCVSRHI